MSTPSDNYPHEGHRLDGTPTSAERDAFTPLPDERTVDEIAAQDAHEHVAQFCALDIEDGQADGHKEAA